MSALTLPAIQSDPSMRAVLSVLDRWDDLPVSAVLVWRMREDSNVDALRHIAKMLGVGHVDLSTGDPLVVLGQAVNLAKRRGTTFAIKEALRALGYASETVSLANKVAYLHDGSFDHDGLYIHGGDNHWAKPVITIELAAPLTLAQAQAAWRAIEGAQGGRDWPRLRLLVDDVTVAFYRERPEA
jgi:P2-related tail formation protein